MFENFSLITPENEQMHFSYIFSTETHDIVSITQIKLGDFKHWLCRMVYLLSEAIKPDCICTSECNMDQ